MGLSFDDFYLDTSHGIYRFVSSRVASRQDAEDLVGDIYYRAFRNVESHTKLTKAWIYTIASNVLKNYYRDHKLTDLLSEDIPCVNSVEDEILSGERTKTLMSAIRRLAADEQLLVSLRYYAQLSYKDISKVMGISASAAKTRMSRSLDKLEKLIDGKEL